MASEEKKQESLGEKLLLLVCETLIFGGLLLLFGFWLNLRLESYKHSLVKETEENKHLLSLLQPKNQQRLEAYIEIQKAARAAKDILEIYYGNVGLEKSDYSSRVNQLESLLKDKSGIGSGVRSSTWVTLEEAVSVIRDIILLRENHKYILSDEVKLGIDQFIDILIQDLEDSVYKSKSNEIFANRLRNGFNQLNTKIENALRIEKLIIK